MDYAKSDLIEVQGFTRQREGEEAVIGLPATNTFLALPAEALEILDNLSQGKTVGEAQAEFARAHGIEPDMEDLLHCLERRGFLSLRDRDSGANLPFSAATASPIPKKGTRYHFASISQPSAKRLFGPFPLALYLTVIGAALLVALAHPSWIPGRSSLVFAEHRTVKILSLSFIAYCTIFMHEFAHLLAAKAQGVDSRFGISNRLWVLVAETDMTGLWAVPKRKRYLPMLAGPLLDSFSAALLFLFYAYSKSARPLASTSEQIVKALIFMYMFRLLWQCNLFVRTDFYYVITTFFGCKNLMKDTESYLRNLFLRIVGSKKYTDQSHIPLRERRAIRMYSVLWLFGRGVAFFSLFFITIPVLAHYLSGAFLALRRGYSGSHYQYLDSVLVGALNLIPLVLGLSLWITSFARKRRSA